VIWYVCSVYQQSRDERHNTRAGTGKGRRTSERMTNQIRASESSAASAALLFPSSPAVRPWALRLVRGDETKRNVWKKNSCCHLSGCPPVLCLLPRPLIRPMQKNARSCNVFFRQPLVSRRGHPRRASGRGRPAEHFAAAWNISAAGCRPPDISWSYRPTVPSFPLRACESFDLPCLAGD
jgi:hypothetical protein